MRPTLSDVSGVALLQLDTIKQRERGGSMSKMMTALSLSFSMLLCSCVVGEEGDLESDQSDVDVDESTIESELVGTVTCTPGPNQLLGICTASSLPTKWTGTKLGAFWIYNSGKVTTNYRCTDPEDASMPGPFLVTAVGVGSTYVNCE